MSWRLLRCAPTARKTASKPPAGLLGHEILDLVVRGRSRRRCGDAVDLAVEHFARQPVLRDAEVHHPAGHAARPRRRRPRGRSSAQVPRGRQAARSGADDEHPLAGGRFVGRDRPPFLERHVAEEPLDGVDADRLVDVLAVAGVLARVIADAAVHGRHRVVADDDLPGLAVAAGLRLGEPGLHVLAGRAGVVAGRQAVDVERALRPDGRSGRSGGGVLRFGGHG